MIARRLRPDRSVPTDEFAAVTPSDGTGRSSSNRRAAGMKGAEMARQSSLNARVLLDGLALVESPRWHENRLWFSHWGMEQFMAVGLDGTSEVVAPGPPRLGWATDWLPDGRRLITGNELMREEPDGTLVRHADLSHLTPYGWSEIVVDGRGNVYVNSINFDF